jgi:hypothetical protein
LITKQKNPLYASKGMGIIPSENEISDFMVSKKQVRNYSKKKKQVPLCW